MAQNLESNLLIRYLLASPEGNNPALTPPPSDGSLSPNNSISSNEEDHGTRPNLTYSALVTMAIRSSPEGKLTLNSIQSWISENFSYYKKDEQGWQNQIRQTLSTSSCFLKVPRAVNDPGRGNYWALSSELPAVGTAGVGNGSTIGALVNGVLHPQAPNAVYFPTPQEVQGAHQTQLVQYQDVYQKLIFHQQKVEFLTSQQIST